MIRAIIKHKRKDPVSGAVWEELQTLDVECPVLENALRVGGMDQNGYHVAELVGVELRE